jgi:hypothetical protein
MRAKGRGLHDCKGAKPCTEERKDGYLNQKEQYSRVESRASLKRSYQAYLDQSYSMPSQEFMIED